MCGSTPPSGFACAGTNQMFMLTKYCKAPYSPTMSLEQVQRAGTTQRMVSRLEIYQNLESRWTPASFVLPRHFRYKPTSSWLYQTTGLGSYATHRNKTRWRIMEQTTNLTPISPHLSQHLGYSCRQHDNIKLDRFIIRYWMPILWVNSSCHAALGIWQVTSRIVQGISRIICGRVPVPLLEAV